MDTNPPPVAHQPKKGIPVWAWGLIGCAVSCPCILAAILYPVFSQARAAAKRTSTIASLRQIGDAAFMYSADNDDHFPFSKNWEDTLLAYVSSDDVFTDGNATGTFINKRGFAMNKSSSGVKTTIENAEDYALFFTATMDEVSAVGDKTELRYDTGGRAFICFADGSVRSFSPETVSEAIWEFPKK